MTRNDFSDEDLTAFLDGEADAALSAQIAAAVDQDAALQKRLASLDLQLASIKASFDALLSAAPEMGALPEAVEQQHSGASGAKLFAAMAASLVIGAFIGIWALPGEKPRGWQDYAAAYHVLYVNGTLADIESNDAETSAVLSQLSSAVGHDLSAAPLDRVLEYKRGQVLGYEGRPLIQLAYLSPLGDPVALCLVRTDAPDTDIEMTALEGLAAAKWQSDGIAYLLIGGTDAGLIADAAARFSASL